MGHTQLAPPLNLDLVHVHMTALFVRVVCSSTSSLTTPSDAVLTRMLLCCQLK